MEDILGFCDPDRDHLPWPPRQRYPEGEMPRAVKPERGIGPRRGRKSGGWGGEACDDGGTGLGSEKSLVGSKLEELLRAEHAKHEKELEKEKMAAEARVAALELRLVQTAQARMTRKTSKSK